MSMPNSSVEVETQMATAFLQNVSHLMTHSRIQIAVMDKQFGMVG